MGAFTNYDMTLVLQLCFAAVALALVALAYLVRRRTRLPLPPGPRGSWYAGVAPLLSRVEPWKQYAAWCQDYGDIISFRVFNRRFVVLNTAEAAHELLNKCAAVYSDRPRAWMFFDLVGRGQAVFNIPATDARHQKYRRALHAGLNARATLEYASLLEDETSVLLQRLEHAPEQLEAHIRRHAGAIIMKLAFGYTATEETDFFIRSAEESAQISGWAMAPGRWLVDCFPLLRFVPAWVPGAGFQRQAAAWRARLDALTDAPHAWVKRQMATGKHAESFTSRLLSAGADEDIVKWSAAGLYAGAADTTISAMLSFVMLMALHPAVQRAAQAEIDAVVGTERLPRLADTQDLPYLTCVLQEVLRFAPVGPLALPHCAAADDTYAGFRIPQGATVLANVWAILHDQHTYPDPFAFTPARFAPPHAQPDPRAPAFGFGRRACPGTAFAEASMRVAMAGMLARYTVVPRARAPQEVRVTTGITSHIEVFPVEFVPRGA